MAAFNNGVVLGTSTTVAGFAVLPHVGGYALLRYGVLLAIIGGLTIALGQIVFVVYRRLSIKR